MARSMKSSIQNFTSSNSNAMSSNTSVSSSSSSNPSSGRKGNYSRPTQLQRLAKQALGVKPKEAFDWLSVLREDAKMKELKKPKELVMNWSELFHDEDSIANELKIEQNVIQKSGELLSRYKTTYPDATINFSGVLPASLLLGKTMLAIEDAFFIEDAKFGNSSVKLIIQGVLSILQQADDNANLIPHEFVVRKAEIISFLKNNYANLKNIFIRIYDVSAMESNTKSGEKIIYIYPSYQLLIKDSTSSSANIASKTDGRKRKRNTVNPDDKTNEIPSKEIIVIKPGNKRVNAPKPPPSKKKKLTEEDKKRWNENLVHDVVLDEEDPIQEVSDSSDPEEIPQTQPGDYIPSPLLTSEEE